MHATATATVAAPVAQVWALLADHEGMARWAPGLKVTLVQPGQPDRNGVGAQRRIKAAPLLPALVEEVTAFEPERRLGYRGVSGIPLRNYAGEITLQPAGAGTASRLTSGAQLPASSEPQA